MNVTEVRKLAVNLVNNWDQAQTQDRTQAGIATVLRTAYQALTGFETAEITDAGLVYLACLVLMHGLEVKKIEDRAFSIKEIFDTAHEESHNKLSAAERSILEVLETNYGGMTLDTLAKNLLCRPDHVLELITAVNRKYGSGFISMDKNRYHLNFEVFLQN